MLHELCIKRELKRFYFAFVIGKSGRDCAHFERNKTRKTWEKFKQCFQDFHYVRPTWSNWNMFLLDKRCVFFLWKKMNEPNKMGVDIWQGQKLIICIGYVIWITSTATAIAKKNNITKIPVDLVCETRSNYIYFPHNGISIGK